MPYTCTFYQVEFSDDYSNVVDGIELYLGDVPKTEVFDRINFNRNDFQGASVKLELSNDFVSVIDSGTYNYCKIQIEYKGSQTYNNVTYYFINSFRVISSSENTTIVEFELGYDFWNNRQNKNELPEMDICAVERAHVDRWKKDSDYPSRITPINENVSGIYSVTARETLSFDKIAWVQESGLMNYLNTNQIEISYGMGSLGTYHIEWALISYIDINDTWEKKTAGYDGGRPSYLKETADDIKVIVVPIDNRNDSEIPCVANGGMDYFECRSQSLDVRDYYVHINPFYLDTSNHDYHLSHFIPKEKIMSGDLGKILGVTNESIVSIQILSSAPLLLVNSTRGDNVNAIIYKTGYNQYKPLCLREYDSDDDAPKYCAGYLEVEQGDFWYTGIFGEPTFKRIYGICFRERNPITDMQNLHFYDMNTISDGKFELPTKPSYSEIYPSKSNFEPALYMNPFVKRYITNPKGEVLQQIPDLVLGDDYRIFVNILVGTATSSTAYVLLRLGSIVEYIGEIASKTLEGMNTFSTCGYGNNISDAWRNYSITSLDADRRLMKVNMITGFASSVVGGGVGGSIGYRSNHERELLSSPGSRAQEVYGSMAKQSFVVGVANGVVQGALSAWGTAEAQRNKEQIQRNTPGQSLSSSESMTQILSTQWKSNYVDALIVTKVDQPTYDYYRTIFAKYGYYLNVPMVPELDSRKYFNYIRTNGAVIKSKGGMAYACAKLCNIFDSGVTIWHYARMKADGIKMYDYNCNNCEEALK